jgi:hypothetical protein
VKTLSDIIITNPFDFSQLVWNSELGAWIPYIGIKKTRNNKLKRIFDEKL